jgi:LacI family transcriptional regulator
MSTLPGSATAHEPTPIRSPTILDLAALAGVSKTTVSRVLNGSPRVAPVTRARVVAAVEELGFQVNQAARSLRTSRTGLVGVMVPIISIFGVIVEELDRGLADAGLSILMTSSRRRDPDRDLDAIEMLVRRGADALVLAPSDDRNERLASYLRSVRAPIVLLDRDVPGIRADVIRVDHSVAVHDALVHLLAAGRRRIGLLTRDRKTRPGRELLAAFERASVALGRPTTRELVAEFDDLDRAAGRDGVDALVDAGADGIVSTGTLEHTASVLERLGERGYLVPRDLSLVVFGHLGAPLPHLAGLPTIAYPVEEVARLTQDLVLARLAGSTGKPRVKTVRTLFLARDVVGDTTPVA